MSNNLALQPISRKDRLTFCERNPQRLIRRTRPLFKDTEEEGYEMIESDLIGDNKSCNIMYAIRE